MLLLEKKGEFSNATQGQSIKVKNGTLPQEAKNEEVQGKKMLIVIVTQGVFLKDSERCLLSLYDNAPNHNVQSNTATYSPGIAKADLLFYRLKSALIEVPEEAYQSTYLA